MALPAIEQDGRRMDWVYPLDKGRVGTDKVPQNEHMARDGVEHQRSIVCMQEGEDWRGRGDKEDAGERSNLYAQ